MAKPDNVIDKRMVNALIEGAETSRLGHMLLNGAGKGGVKLAQRMMGGLWVGGNAYLTPDTIEFHPNGLNKLFHRSGGSMAVVLNLADLTDVTHRYGVATKIIDLSTAGTKLSIRCYNSKTFVEAIQTARGSF